MLFWNFLLDLTFKGEPVKEKLQRVAVTYWNYLNGIDNTGKVDVLFNYSIVLYNWLSCVTQQF